MSASFRRLRVSLHPAENLCLNGRTRVVQCLRCVALAFRALTAYLLEGVGDDFSFGPRSSTAAPRPIAARVLAGALCEFYKLGHDFVFARLRDAEGSRIAIRLRVLAELVEASIAIARTLRGVGIDLVEVGEHRGHRRRQTI